MSTVTYLLLVLAAVFCGLQLGEAAKERVLTEREQRLVEISHFVKDLE